MTASFGPASVAAFIALIGILIFVHELGHFLAAKYFGIKVLKFSLGFGPPLVAFQRGDTTYQLAAVPLGGYVKMLGDHPGEELTPAEQAQSFTGAPIYQRAVIALAGPLFNLIFPVLCYFAFYLLGPTVGAPYVGQVEIGTPAEKAGLQSGDRIVQVDGARVWSFARMAELVSARPGVPVQLTVERGGKEVHLEAIPRSVDEPNMFGERQPRGRIGVVQHHAGTRIGVFDSTIAPQLQTGDRILKIGSKKLSRWHDLVEAFRGAAGSKVAVELARPAPLAAGGLLYAENEQVITVSMDVPATFQEPEDLGMAPSGMFLRTVVPGGAAEAAGLRPGDELVAVNGRSMRLFWSFLSEVQEAQDQPLDIRVRREGKLYDVQVASRRVTDTHPVTQKPYVYFDPGLGAGAPPRRFASWVSIVAGPQERVELSYLEAVQVAFRQTGQDIELTAIGIGKLFTREVSTDTVGGPISIFRIAAQAAEMGVFNYLKVLALISVSLGLINLLPVPIFDGGHLLFCLVESIKREPLSLRTREAANIVGLLILVALFVLAMKNDFKNLGLF